MFKIYYCLLLFCCHKEMKMLKRMFRVNNSDFTLNYSGHTSQKARRNYLSGVEMLLRMVHSKKSFVALGLTLGYNDRAQCVGLDKIQKHLRDWIRMLKGSYYGPYVLGGFISIETGHYTGRVHGHVMVYMSVEGDNDVSVCQRLCEMWLGVTRGEGVYCNENVYGYELKKEGEVSSVGKIKSTDTGKIIANVEKIGYMTKSGYRPMECDMDKRRIFITF